MMKRNNLIHAIYQLHREHIPLKCFLRAHEHLSNSFHPSPLHLLHIWKLINDIMVTIEFITKEDLKQFRLDYWKT